MNWIEVVKCKKTVLKMDQFNGHTGPWLLMYALKYHSVRQMRHCSNHHPVYKKFTKSYIPVKLRDLLELWTFTFGHCEIENKSGLHTGSKCRGQARKLITYVGWPVVEMISLKNSS